MLKLKENPRVLLICPEYPDTLWNFKHALKFISRKTGTPPLGLLTVAAMLPAKWQLKLVDMNIRKLTDEDLAWADYVMISAISVQRQSVNEILERCQGQSATIIAGGPLFTSDPESFATIDHLILNEAEITLPPFLKDLENGQAKHIYRTDQWADVTHTPKPAWHLIARDMKHYATMNVQYSRGCPFNCDFCDITSLYGRGCRSKDAVQTVQELEFLHRHGWDRAVFFVDDNFIGNIGKLKREVLPAVIEWQKANGFPFNFLTQASINIADDEELMSLMVAAGFKTVFIGIETPNEDSLAECEKNQNKNRDLAEAVHKLQRFGLRVQAGFIVGFDSDPADIFEKQINFIQRTNIVAALVGLLNAPRGTKLYARMAKEGRLNTEATGDNSDFSMNFRPAMDKEKLMAGYRKILKTIYAPEEYYRRIKSFVAEYKVAPSLKKYRLPRRPWRLRLNRDVWVVGIGFIKSLFCLGLLNRGRRQYWGLMFWAFFRRPQHFALVATLTVYGFHFRKVLKVIN